MRSVENAECGKCGVWKMRSVKEKYIKSLKERKKKVISPHVGITRYNSFQYVDPGKAQYS